ncbi:MAG: hypothetical protein ABSC32_21025 [Steroidobacteraceae bacterium]|jgi:hypothetical protein
MKMIKHSARQATVTDAAIIARHRVGMFRDMGQVPTDVLAGTLLETSTVALEALLRARAVTTAPVPLVANVYTEPDFRGMRIARALMYLTCVFAPMAGNSSKQNAAFPGSLVIYIYIYKSIDYLIYLDPF